MGLWASPKMSTGPSLNSQIWTMCVPLISNERKKYFRAYFVLYDAKRFTQHPLWYSINNWRYTVASKRHTKVLYFLVSFRFGHSAQQMQKLHVNYTSYKYQMSVIYKSESENRTSSIRKMATHLAHRLNSNVLFGSRMLCKRMPLPYAKLFNQPNVRIASNHWPDFWMNFNLNQLQSRLIAANQFKFCWIAIVRFM